MEKCKNCSRNFSDSFMDKYIIQRGDTLSALAKKFQVSYCSLVSANPKIKDPNVIEPGEEIFIPKGTFTLILSNTPEAPNSIGMASIKMNPAEIVIVGLNIPEPGEYGLSYKGFRVMIVNNDTGEQTSIEMEKVLDGMWLGKRKGNLLMDFHEIYLTPIGESEGTVTGPKVLRGRMIKCLMLQR